MATTPSPRAGWGDTPVSWQRGAYLVYDLLGSAGSTGFLGYLIADMLRTAFGVHIPWWLIALVTFAVIWTLTHNGIQLSMRVTALLGGLELLIMLSLAVTFLVHPGKGSTYTAPLDPSLSPHHFGGILAGMVFSILALSGFEGPAPLAQESRRAGKFVGQAVILSLTGYRRLLHLHLLCERDRLGHWRHGGLRRAPQSVLRSGSRAVGNRRGGSWCSALINSAIAVGLACTNSASRVMYTMGRAGTLPAWFGRIHPAHQTPTNAIAFVQMVGIVAVLLVGLLLQPAYIFGLLETIATLGGHRHLLHGEPGVDVVYPAGASIQFQHLASRGFALDRDAGTAAGAVCHGLSGARMAV